MRRKKGQVAPVATIMGLMIVVTIIANYVSTALPGQMSVNDENRGLLVQDQIGHLAALIEAVAANHGTGHQVSQPITLGSDAAPPFAGPDGATVTPLDPRANMTVNFTIVGTGIYTAPSGGIPNSGSLGSGCTFSNTSTSGKIGCTGNAAIVWNFSVPKFSSYNISFTGGGHSIVNVTASYSTILLSSQGGPLEYLQVIGSHDNVTVNAPGGLTSTIIIFGNFDNLTFSSTSSGLIHLYVVGNHDNVVESHTGASYTLIASYFGSYDTFTAGTASGTESVFFTGFNAFAPVSAACPYDNLSSTDSVAGGSNKATLTVTFNNTAYSGSGTLATYWSASYNLIGPPYQLCPFFTFPQRASFNEHRYAGLVVHLANTYAPSAEVALDDGAVVVAQPGGTPIVLDPPFISVTGTAATILIPGFLGGFGEESGVGTADFSLRLVAALTLSTLGSGLTLLPGTYLTITVYTPYASGWMSYYAAHPIPGTVTCTGPTAACVGPYTSGGPMGKVVLTILATTANVELAVFAPTLS